MNKKCSILLIVFLVIGFQSAPAFSENKISVMDKYHCLDKNGNIKECEPKDRRYYDYTGSGVDNPEAYQRIQKKYEEDMAKILIDAKYDGRKNSIGDKSEYDSIIHKEDVYRNLKNR